LQKHNEFTTIWQEIFAGQNFADLPQYFNRENLTTMQATLFACSRCGLLWKNQLLRAFVHVCAMAMDCYFSSVEKVPKTTLLPVYGSTVVLPLLPAILRLLQRKDDIASRCQQ